MNLNWVSIITFQVLVWLVVLFERKRLKRSTKSEKIAFASILAVVVLLSLFNLESIPGPTTLLHYIFGRFGKIME